MERPLDSPLIIVFGKEASGLRLFASGSHKPLVSGSNPLPATSISPSNFTVRCAFETVQHFT